MNEAEVSDEESGGQAQMYTPVASLVSLYESAARGAERVYGIYLKSEGRAGRLDFVVACLV